MMYENLSNRLRGEAEVSDASPYFKELMRQAADALDHFENITRTLQSLSNAPTIIPADGNMDTDFCREHNVTVTIDDEWKTREKRVILRKGNYAVVRRICYDSIPTILQTGLLNEMLNEIQAEEGET